MKISFWRLALPSFDIEGGGAGAPAPPAAPAAAPGGGPSGGNPSTAAPSAPSGGAPAPTPAAQPGPKQYTYTEDRSNWVPSHVVRQRTEQAQQYQRELEHARQQVAALTGVKLPETPNPERDAIRNQLFQVAPELKELFDLKEKMKELGGLDIKSTIEQIRESQAQAWTQHGTRILNSVADAFKAAYGGAELAPKAVQRIQRAFIAEVEADPQLRQRLEAGDMTAINEYVQDFTGVVLDPYRRSTASQMGQAPAARRLPRGGGGSAITAPSARTVKPSDGDAYHKSAFEQFQRNA